MPKRGNLFLRTIVIFLLAGTVLSAFSNPYSKNDTIIFGSDYNYPPYEFLDKRGNPTGFHVDLIRAIGERAGIPVIVKLSQWDKIREELENTGTVNVSDMFYTEIRDSVVDFAIPHEIMFDLILYRKGEKPLSGYEDLSERRTGIQKASSVIDYLNAHYPYLEREEYLTEQEAVWALLKGDVDAAIVSNITFLNLKKNYKIGKRVGTSGPLFAREFSFVVDQGNSEMLRVINSSLAELKQDGTYGKLHDKWFRQDIRMLIFRYIAAGIFLLVIAYFWLITLRKRVKAKTSDLEDEIAERKKAEALLKNQYREIRSVYRNSPVGLAFIGVDYRINRINNMMARFYDSDIVKLSGQSIRKIGQTNFPIDISILDSIISNQSSASSNNNSGEQGGISSIRYDRWLSHYNPVIDENNDLHGVIVATQDISELSNAKESLRRSEELFRGIVVNSTDLIALADDKGTITYLSPNAEIITGYRMEEMVGSKLPPLIHPEDIDRVSEALQNLVETGGQIRDFQYRVVERSGKVRWVTHTATTAYVDEKKIGILYNIRDITKQKKLESELMAARDKALDSDRIKSSFLANMSHEIRTPLNAIVGFSDIMISENNIKEPELTYFEIINQASKQLIGIVSDILEMSKIEAGHINISYSRVTIGEILSDTESLNIHSILSKNLKLNKNIGPDPSFVILTDPVKLKQILSNLIQNAVKFTEEGSIEIGCKRDGQDIIFWIRDTGVGIDEVSHSIIFDRFRQVNESFTRTHGGAGLGLSISKGIVEKMGGRIWVESTKGEGATFFISLPLKSSDEGALKDEANDQELEYLKPDQPIVLIAEDENPYFLYLSTLFRKSGLATVRAVNGEEAIDLTDSIPGISLVLMDLRMPVVDGFTATEVITKREISPPIVALTAFNDEAEVKRALLSGCKEVLIKPVSPAQIIDLVDRYKLV